MQVNNLKSLLGEIAGLPSELQQMGYDGRYFYQQLKGLGFVQVNDSYYRQIIEHKGKRMVLGCKVRGTSFTVTLSNRKVTNGRFIDYVKSVAYARERMERMTTSYSGIIDTIMPNDLAWFDNLSQHNNFESWVN